MNLLSPLEPWSWVAAIIVAVLGLGSVYAFFSRRYKSSATARRRLLQRRLSHLTLGTPQSRVYELVGQQPTRVWNLDEGSRPGGGRLETFEFPDADLKIVVEKGIVQVLSIKAKSPKFRMALHGSNDAPSLVVGEDTFGDVPGDAVSYRGLCNGSSKGMNWYFEYRDIMGEADPNIWVYGWTPYGFTRDERWWFVHLPKWLVEGFAAENDPTPEEASELEAFRQGMPINVVVAVHHYETTPRSSLRTYL